jgi:hypothetical protein
MVTIINDRRAVPELEMEIERLRRLADDLEDIRFGRHPGRRTLATAPRIESWSLSRRSVVCLTGRVFGHPAISEGGIGVTTDVWALAPGLGYARTLSRYYALGMPESQGSRERHSGALGWNDRR